MWFWCTIRGKSRARLCQNVYNLLFFMQISSREGFSCSFPLPSPHQAADKPIQQLPNDVDSREVNVYLVLLHLLC